MSVSSEIKRRLQEMFSGGIALPITCEVVSVEELSCTVKINGGLEIPDVRLRATLKADASNEVLLTPKIGSKALVWSVSGSFDDLVLVKCDQIASISYKQDGLEVLIDSETKKITLKNESVSLKSLMQELHDLIQNIKVTTPSGPSTGVLPDTTASLLQFKNNFQNLLN